MDNGYRGVVGESAPGGFVVLAGVPEVTVNSPFGKELWRYTVADGRWARVPDPGVRIIDVCQAGNATVVLTVKILSDGEVVAEDQPYEGGTDAYVRPSVRVLGPATGAWAEVLDMPAVDDRPVWNGEAVIGWPRDAPGGTMPVASSRSPTSTPPASS
jgi:hypothetical protein